MTCLTDEQIEQLTSQDSEESIPPAIQAHLRNCVQCRLRFDQAKVDATMVNDLKELAEYRNQVKPLLDGRIDADSP